LLIPCLPENPPISVTPISVNSFITTPLCFSSLTLNTVPLTQSNTSTTIVQDALEAMLIRLACVAENKFYPSELDPAYLLKRATDALVHTILCTEIQLRELLETGYMGVDFAKIKLNTIETLRSFTQGLFLYQFVKGLRTLEVCEKITRFHNSIIGIQELQDINTCINTSNLLSIFMDRIIIEPLLTSCKDLYSVSYMFRSLSILLLRAKIMQSIIDVEIHDQNLQNMSPSVDDNLEVFLEAFQAFHKLIQEQLQLSSKPLDLTTKAFIVLRSCLPFIRCIAVIYSIITSCLLPDLSLCSNTLQEYDLLLKFLQLPLLENILDVSDDCLPKTVKGWSLQLKQFNILRKKNEDISVKNWEEGIPRCTFAKLFKLIDLPVNYHQILEKFKDDIEKISEPVVCLLCGTVVDANSRVRLPGASYMGECSYHSLQCGGGQGLFLFFNHVTVIAYVNELAYQLPSPFLDQFGELQRGLKRGKQLTLHAGRYQSLCDLFINHKLGKDDSVPIGTGTDL